MNPSLTGNIYPQPKMFQYYTKLSVLSRGQHLGKPNICFNASKSIFNCSVFSQRRERKVMLRWETADKIFHKRMWHLILLFTFFTRCRVSTDWAFVFWSSPTSHLLENCVSQSHIFSQKLSFLSCKYTIFLWFLWHCDISFPFKNVSSFCRTFHISLVWNAFSTH